MTLDYFYGQSGELFSYFRIPKALFQDSRFRQLSTDARTLYGILLDRMSLSVKNGWMDKQGRVYIIYTVREVQESLCCAEHKAVKLFRELEQIDLIERKRRGLGRPSLIYVKDFTTGLSKMHNSLTLRSKFFRLWLLPSVPVSACGVPSTCWKVMVTTTPAPMLMYGKVSQENYVELTAASAIPNKEIKSPPILRY